MPVRGISLQLHAIRQGGGYLDTAQDLIKLSMLVEENEELVRVDTRHYIATDKTDAHRLASRIHEELDAQSPEELNTLRDQLNRTWTFLVSVWEHTCLAGQLLFRNEPEAKDRFDSIYSLGRSPASRSPEGSTTTDTPPVEEPDSETPETP